MLKKWGQKANQLIKEKSNDVAHWLGDTVETYAGEKPGQWMREATKGVGQASGKSVEVFTTLTEGAYKAVSGEVNKDVTTRNEGLGDVKDTAKTVGKSIVTLVKNTSSSVYETGAGLATKDYERMRAGLWKGSQIAVVAFAAVGVVDFIDGGNVVYAESINDHYEGADHPNTHVPFERTEIQYAGETISGVYPVFDSAFSAQLQPAEYTLSDAAHESIANAQLHAAIIDNPTLQAELHLSDADVQALAMNVTPEGYTWHHHEQPGELQLVDSYTHNETAHTGGRFIWGGGSEAR